ncbi:MAG: hypothetical protein ABIF10_07215 [Candidatus Woesearchaeota archaeon]
MDSIELNQNIIVPTEVSRDGRNRIENVEKNASLILSFEEYGERKYKNDFVEWVRYQTERKIKKNQEEIEDVYFKLYKDINNFQITDYVTFRKQSAEYLGKAYFSMIRDPRLFVTPELNLQVRLIRDEYGSWEFQDDASTLVDACFTAGGKWFIQNITATLLHYRNIDYRYIERFVVDQIGHYNDLVRQKVDRGADRLLYDDKFDTKMKAMAKKYGAYSLSLLYQALFNLRDEGIVDLNTRVYSDRLEIDMDAGQKFRKNLEELAGMRLMKDGKSFYEQKIGWGNATRSGELGVGRQMGIFIALALAKEQNLPYQVEITGKKSFPKSYHEELDDWLGKYRKLFIYGLPPKAIQQAIAMGERTFHYDYVRLYEKACDTLEIRKNRLITSNFLIDLKMFAIENAAAERKKMLNAKGFVAK